MRAALAAVLAVLAACGGGGGGSSTDGGDCPPGWRAKAGGGCEPIPGPDGCPAGSMSSTDGKGCRPVGWTLCPGGFAADPTGWGCRELHAATCPIGQSPRLGSSECVAVGVTACPTGFQSAPSGWGCVEIAPPAACTGATRETLGQAICQPVGDCNAAFPPAGATRFVDDSYTVAQVNATHFKTIFQAASNAPAGTVIAVEAGTYVYNFPITSAVTIIGRCAQQVILQPSGGSEPGLILQDPVAVTVEGMTIRNHATFGALVNSGAMLTLRRVVLEGNKDAGILVDGAGSKLRLEASTVRGTLAGTRAQGHGIHAQNGARLEVEDSTIVGNRERGIALLAGGGTPATATVNRSLILGTVEAAGLGVGISDEEGATLVVTESAVVGTAGLGIHVLSAPSHVDLMRSVVRNTVPSATPDSGWGINVVSGGSVAVTDSTLAGNNEGGASIGDQGSAGTFTGTTIEDTLPATTVHDGRGVGVVDHATATLTRTAIVHARNAGLIVANNASATVAECLIADSQPDAAGTGGHAASIQQGGTLTMTDSALLRNQSASLRVSGAGSTASATGILIGDTQRSPMYDSGRGVEVSAGGSADLHRSALFGNREVAVASTGAGATLLLENVAVHDTVGDTTGAYGHALFVEKGGLITMHGGALAMNRHSALAAYDADSRALLDHVVMRDTQSTTSGEYGRGMEIASGAHAELQDCAVITSRDIGMLVHGGSASLAASLVRGTLKRDDGGFGHGILVMQSGTLALDDSEVRANQGIGLVFDDGGAVLRDLRVVGNSVGIHTQNGMLTESATPPDMSNAPDVVLSSDSTFVNNGTRFGAGMVPVPTPSAAPKPPTADPKTK